MENPLRLRLLSYNIHSCFGSDGKYDPFRVRDVILQANADIVALQEVDSSLEVNDGIDQLRFLAESSGMYSVQGATLKRAYGAYGNAFLCRYPLQDVIETDLTYRRFEPRGMIDAAITIDGFGLRIINTHLGLKYWERRFQVERVISEVKRNSARTFIVMGDFNEWLPWTGNQRRLARHLGPTTRKATFPAIWPRFALDRIYINPQPEWVRHAVLDTDIARLASDHLPVLAEIEFARMVL